MDKLLAICLALALPSCLVASQAAAPQPEAWIQDTTTEAVATGLIARYAADGAWTLRDQTPNQLVFQREADEQGVERLVFKVERRFVLVQQREAVRVVVQEWALMGYVGGNERWMQFTHEEAMTELQAELDAAVAGMEASR